MRLTMKRRMCATTTEINRMQKPTRLALIPMFLPKGYKPDGSLWPVVLFSALTSSVVESKEVSTKKRKIYKQKYISNLRFILNYKSRDIKKNQSTNVC